MRIPYEFTPAGDVTKVVWLDETPSYIVAARKRKETGSRLKGLEYEARIHGILSERYPDSYLPGPWLQYRSNGGSVYRTAQPDGLLFNLDVGQITVVEIKLRHTARAWWQLRQLYAPIIQKAFPDWTVRVAEVFCNYKMWRNFPEEITHVDSLSEVLSGPDKFYTYQRR